MITRRQLITRGAVAGAGLAVGGQLGWSRLLAAQALAAAPLPGRGIPQFVEPLPLLDVAGGQIQTILADANPITLAMREFQAKLLPPGLVPGYAGTWVWGYRTGSQPDGPLETFTGPVIVATRGTPTEIEYVNELTTGAETSVRSWYEATDQTLHWADPLGTGHSMEHYDGPIPVVPHLHGGEVPPVLDGGPDAWFTSDGEYHGHAYYAGPGGGGERAVYRYPNTQEAAPIWFHDHALGITRLNVYAGLAGAYPIVDPELELPTGLHPVGLQQGSDGPVTYTIPLVIQDRSFDVNGELLIPNLGLNPEHPYWVPEFVGDAITVNGKTWPYLAVEPRRYRFLLINGSNARAYDLFFTNPVTKADGPALWQIATDGGYLDAPVRIDPTAPKGQLQRLVLLPGERAEVIVDFAAAAGQTLVLNNVGRHPFPKGAPPHGASVGRILQIRVGGGPVADASYDPAGGTPLRPPLVRLVDPATGTTAAGVAVDRTRQLTLNEVMGMGGPLEVLVNNTKWAGTDRADFTAVTVGGDTEYFSEFPEEGTTELWEIVNLTADAHPIHTHLTQFQVLNRQSFNVNRYTRAYDTSFPGGVYLPGYGPPLHYTTGNQRALGGNPDIQPFLQGPASPPAANEAGWKDTVLAHPGQVTRIVVRFAPTDAPVGDDAAYPFDPDAGGHGYVWHCHIVDHEDNEMMRPFRVTPKDVPRTYVEGEDY